MNRKRCELVTISLCGQHRRQMVTVYCYGEFLTKSAAIARGSTIKQIVL